MSPEQQLEPVDFGRLVGLRRPGEGPESPTALLLHGYGGDERVMWVFAGALSNRWRVVSLRGVAPAEDGGFRWHVGRRWPPPGAEAFDLAVDALRRALPAPERVLWIGFSQGAALALCCAARGLPAMGVACLAGYLPENLVPLSPGLSVYWTHGRRDDKVPIESARAAADVLRRWGVRLEFCEADGGHKVGAECLKGLRRWVDGLTPPV